MKIKQQKGIRWKPLPTSFIFQSLLIVHFFLSRKRVCKLYQKNGIKSAYAQIKTLRDKRGIKISDFTLHTKLFTNYKDKTETNFM